MHNGFTQAGSIEPPSGGGYRLNPWFSAWTRPRETIRQVLDTDSKRYVLRLAAAGGIARMYDLAESRNLGGHFPLPVVLAGVVILGALAGIAALYFYAWALERTSTWISIEVSMEDCRTAAAWPSVLLVWAFIPLAVKVLILGPDTFTAATPRLDAAPCRPLRGHLGRGRGAPLPGAPELRVNGSAVRA